MQFIMPNNDVAMFFQNSWSSFEIALALALMAGLFYLVSECNDNRFSLDILYVRYVLLG